MPAPRRASEKERRRRSSADPWIKPYVSASIGSTHAGAGLTRGGIRGPNGPSRPLFEHHPPSLARIHVFAHFADPVARHREHEAIVVLVRLAAGQRRAHPLLHDHDVAAG